MFARIGGVSKAKVQLPNFFNKVVNIKLLASSAVQNLSPFLYLTSTAYSELQTNCV